MAELTETIAEMAKVMDRRLTAVAEQLDGISAQQTQMAGPVRQPDRLSHFQLRHPEETPGVTRCEHWPDCACAMRRSLDCRIVGLSKLTGSESLFTIFSGLAP